MLELPDSFDANADGQLDLYGLIPASYRSLLDICEDLWTDASLVYQMRAFILVTDDSPIENMDGRMITVEQLPHCDETCLGIVVGQIK